MLHVVIMVKPKIGELQFMVQIWRKLGFNPSTSEHVSLRARDSYIQDYIMEQNGQPKYLVFICIDGSMD